MMPRSFKYVVFTAAAGMVTWAVVVMARTESPQPTGTPESAETRTTNEAQPPTKTGAEARPATAQVPDEPAEADQDPVEHEERLLEILRDLEDRHDELVAVGAMEAATTVQRQIDRLKATAAGE